MKYFAGCYFERQLAWCLYPRVVTLGQLATAWFMKLEQAVTPKIAFYTEAFLPLSSVHTVHTVSARENFLDRSTNESVSYNLAL
jgi:hypothetical protein